jgi:phenylpropionate dioxygenase-like ring-hydroxylating dioxygenase large terminal subunit
VLVRGDDRRIRAFHNICSHRGNRLVFARRGSAAALTCRYHGWSYALDGSVRNITARERFPGLDPASCALPPVHCDTWRGFVFVNFAAQPAQPLRAFLGGWGDFAERYPFERGDACVTMRYTLDANWKIALDAFQETYHLGYLHLRTMRNMYFTPEDHTGSYLSADLYGPHRRFSIWANPEHKVPESAHVEQLARRYGRNINAGSQSGASILDVCPGLNPTRDPKWAWDNAFVFPNVVVTFAAEIWIMSRFWPLAQDRTRWENFTFYPKPKTASERFSREQGVCHLRDVAAEDVDTMEGATKALKSGARKVINVQESEVAVRHMLHTVERYIHGTA